MYVMVSIPGVAGAVNTQLVPGADAVTVVPFIVQTPPAGDDQSPVAVMVKFCPAVTVGGPARVIVVGRVAPVRTIFVETGDSVVVGVGGFHPTGA